MTETVLAICVGAFGVGALVGFGLKLCWVIRDVSALNVSYLMSISASLQKIAGSVLSPEEAAKRQAEQFDALMKQEVFKPKRDDVDPYEQFVDRVIPSNRF